MNQKMVAALLAGTTILGTVASASAFGGQGRGQMATEMDSDVREAIMQAMEDGDYDAWVQAHEDAGLEGPFSDMTEEEFAEMAEKHAEGGQMQMRGGQGMRQGGQGMGLAQYETFSEWQTAMEDKGFTINEDANEADFNTLKNLQEQMRTLQQKFQFQKGKTQSE